MSRILYQWVVAVLSYEVGSALVCDHVSCQVARTRTKDDLRDGLWAYLWGLSCVEMGDLPTVGVTIP